MRGIQEGVEPVEALRTCFLADLVARKLSDVQQTGGLWDRAGTQWVVFDVDGTREAARTFLPRAATRGLPILLRGERG